MGDDIMNSEFGIVNEQQKKLFTEVKILFRKKITKPIKTLGKKRPSPGSKIKDKFQTPVTSSPKNKHKLKKNKLRITPPPLSLAKKKLNKHRAKAKCLKKPKL